MSWSLRKKKEGIFCTVYFDRRNFFLHLCFISILSVLNTLSEYKYFYISKSISSYTFLLVFKIDENLQCIFKYVWPFQWTLGTKGLRTCAFRTHIEEYVFIEFLPEIQYISNCKESEIKNSQYHRSNFLLGNLRTYFMVFNTFITNFKSMFHSYTFSKRQKTSSIQGV